MSSAAPPQQHPAAAPRGRVGRLVVRGPGDATAAARIAARLPSALAHQLGAAPPADERALRVLFERALREAAR